MLNRLLLACLAAWLVADVAQARDLFVNNVAGDDRFDATAETAEGERAGPARTISKALRVAQAGDRIVIANTGEPYRESITLQGHSNSGLLSRPFVIQGNGATLDGVGPIPAEAWEYVGEGLFRFRPLQKASPVLYLDGTPATKQVTARAALKPAGLEPLEWTVWQGHVYFRPEADRLPESYALGCTGGRTGITLYQVENVEIADLTVQGFAIDGVNVHDGAGPCRLVGLTSRGNGRSGVAVMGASRVVLEACLLGDNFVAQLHTSGLTQTYVVNSDLAGNVAPAWLRESGLLAIDGEKQEARTPE